MNKTERDEVRRLVYDFEQWGRKAADARAWQQAVRAEALRSESGLAAREVVINRAGRSACRVIPLSPGDTDVVRHLRERVLLPMPTEHDLALLRLVAEDAPRAIVDVRALAGVRRLLSGSATKQKAGSAARFLRDAHQAVKANGGPACLDRLGAPTALVDQARLQLEDLLDPDLGFAPVSEGIGTAPELVVRSAFEGLPEALDTIAKAATGERLFRLVAQDAAEKVRAAEVRRMLRDMPLDSLKAVTRDRLRLGPLRKAGISSVQGVLDEGSSLEFLPGVGDTSARRMLGAARALWQTTYDEMPVRIDLEARPKETTELLRGLAVWEACRQLQRAQTDLKRAAELAPLRDAIDGNTSHLLVLPTSSHAVAQLRETIDALRARAAQLGGRASRREGASTDPWDDFMARPADYFAMLSELGFLTEDEEAVRGDLPEEIVEAVRRQPLNGDHLSASLRGYQSFAARFALVQRKVVIGDEMGLGKTVEALAVLAHLRSRGETHFVVVCPASVVTNWVREVVSKSTLRAHRVHGQGRHWAARTWVRDGGVAVTTYDTLKWWERAVPEVPDLACVVADEAHYIKNPHAGRTTRTARLISGVDRAVLLTGTPLENRVEEFRNLVSYLRPDLTVDASDFAPRAFRRQIAPAYLRRNQEDVLTELPELIEVDEWLPMSEPDLARYLDAVRSGNFMQMRQAAILQGRRSQKVRRLLEIVAEAEENERRVIVFSYFRPVLDLVAGMLTGPVFGPLTGSVPASQRQEVIDRFSCADHGAALVSQIQAGGVGLNIQSASVVVICEPQLKPTTEAQAIARAHRMGQLQSVQVHRLLSEDSVDQRITEILAGKRRLFDDFSRVSETAGSTPEAVDLSEAELVKQVVDAERRRLLEVVATDA